MELFCMLGVCTQFRVTIGMSFPLTADSLGKVPQTLLCKSL